MASLTDLEQRIGVFFRNKELLEQALVHRSYRNENPSFPLAPNERLEFLGDAVLGFIVAEELYLRFPDMPEGSLTRLRAALVCQESLCKLAAGIGLGDYLYLGRGEDASGGRTKPSNLARTLEALIGAIYLDQSLDLARKFVLTLLQAELDEQIVCAPVDFKSQLQEFLHAGRHVTPTYRIVETAGPDHEKVFTAEVLEGQSVLGRGTGHSKKDAEAAAARTALKKLRKE